MASKLDYLKKYMSKSEARQLHSQMEKGEQIKIRNSSRVKRRKKQGNRTGFMVCDPERDSQSASSDGSEEEEPLVASYRDDSRDTRDRMWNPISGSDRQDSETELSRRRHDSDSDAEDRGAGPGTHEPPQRSGSDSDFEVERKSPGRKREGSSRFSCTVLSQGDESKETVYRDREGHRVDAQRESELRAEREKEKAERDAKFKVIKSGVVQAKLRQERVNAFAEEAGKGVARYAGDESLNEHLRAKQLLDDPLLKMKRKKTKKKQDKRKCKPTYQGSFPNNRFGIRPGYRWDGADRSNGYEKERFRIINDRQADSDNFYKMGTEDM